VLETLAVAVGRRVRRRVVALLNAPSGLSSDFSRQSLASTDTQQARPPVDQLLQSMGRASARIETQRRDDDSVASNEAHCQREVWVCRAEAGVQRPGRPRVVGYLRATTSPRQDAPQPL
jgi:hypothetical protein